MIVSSALLRDLRGRLKVLEADLRRQAEDPEVGWSGALRSEYDAAFEAGRTGLSWPAWRDGEVSQAAVAWLVAATFVRFCEDNGLLDGATTPDGIPGPWIAGPTDHPAGDRVARAREHQDGFFADHLTANDRDWWHQAFGVLADLPAGRALVDRAHNPVWRALISAEAARDLLTFFRATDESGALVHDFTDPAMDTRFLGDLYQDLSEHAKKTFALLQTPVFVEEFILDRTLEPAIQEFGLTDFTLIDPTCGSGHFLLGAFDRLLAHWTKEAPALDARERVRRALDSVHGVDLNPFAVAIARFRLTVAALKASGERTLVGAPAFTYHLAIGDSLLGEQGTQGDLLSDDEPFAYATEDLADHHHILQPGRYHVVVGNPPYITPKDKALSEAYRKAYATCHRQYALSVPFMELFFRLARRQGPDGGAGHVGQITSNSFMKREFGKKLIENLLSGADLSNPVDLTAVIDTSGMSIPGHNTPTVVILGRRRRPLAAHVSAALGKRGETGGPDSESGGPGWRELMHHFDGGAYDGEYLAFSRLSREALAVHPWSLSGGGAAEVLDTLADSSSRRLGDISRRIGFMGMSHADEEFTYPKASVARHGASADLFPPLVAGDGIRDFSVVTPSVTWFPYRAGELIPSLGTASAENRLLWPLRANLGYRATFGRATYFEAGRPWYEWHQVPTDARTHVTTIAFAFVATHNHFVLDHGDKVFKQTAPVVKFPSSADDQEIEGLFGLLSSSSVCFWLHEKCLGKPLQGEEWQRRYEYDAAKVGSIPVPMGVPVERGRSLESLARALASATPESAVLPFVAAVTGSGGDAASAAEGEVTLAGSAGMGATKESLGTRGTSPSAALAEAREKWTATRQRMVFEQEELDWHAYRLYNLIDTDLTYTGPHDTLNLGERAFEIALARQIEAGTEESAWFERHGSTPITDLPASWPDDYKQVVQRRLEELESNPHIRLLERPEYKRRWATRGWEAMEKDAVTAAILDRLEAPGLWRDANGPTTRSVQELADLLRGDEVLADLLARLAGSKDVDRVPALEKLIAEEAVPYLAALRYKPSGVEKFREWQRVWDLQREEDRIDAKGGGEKPSIPVPPKYGQADFRKAAYWKARGKLDVPKERFISYPGITRSGEASTVLGWAGWDHAEQALALARLITDLGQVSTQIAKPLLAGLVELEPWVQQWHTDIDPAFGTSPAQVITGYLDGQLAEHRLTRDDATAWTPPAATRGRPRKDSTT